MIDPWSAITGLASVLSLVVALPKKYESWRTYTVPVFWGCLGFAFGRFTGLLGPSAQSAFDDPRLIGVLAICAIFAVGSVFILRTIKDHLNVEGIWMFIIIIAASIVITSV